MRDKLLEISLDKDNAIVIGSGILQALGIRKSHDIDLVVTQKEYDRLKKSGQFQVHITKYKKETLTDDTFEIGTSWDVLGKSYEFQDFTDNSIILEGVRYITLDFLYDAKKSWIKEGTVRPKDIADLKLIEKYKKS